MKTINIKGNKYVTVNERLIYFRQQEQFKNWQIVESLVSIDTIEGIFKCTIKDSDGNIVAVAHTQEYRDSSYINKTSFVENGFTSALGRALGYLGIGIDTAIASNDEVTNAKNNQVWLTASQLEATLKGTKKEALNVLKGFKMKDEYREKINNKFKLN
tara:strand:- start:16742 stop:17215 length:474 start_codon:yes stop_codon:yes gene_type:complete